MGFHTGLSVDDVNRIESILDLARTENGLRLMDKLDLWGIKLSRQYDTIQGLSHPMVMSESDEHVVMGEGRPSCLVGVGQYTGRIRCDSRFAFGGRVVFSASSIYFTKRLEPWFVRQQWSRRG